MASGSREGEGTSLVVGKLSGEPVLALITYTDPGCTQLPSFAGSSPSGDGMNHVLATCAS